MRIAEDERESRVRGVGWSLFPKAAQTLALLRTGPRGRSGVRRRLAPYAFLLPTLALMLVLMATPIIMVSGYSVMDNVITNKDPKAVGLANYVEVLGDSDFHVAVRNTLIFTLASIVAHMVLGLLLAVLLNSPSIGVISKSVFRTVLVLPWLFTVAIVAVLWRLILNPNGVLNYLLEAAGLIDANVEWLSDPAKALGAVVLINIWAGYPFYMISLLAGLQGIPGDLYEAATVDGAGGGRKFLHVTLPQLRPLIIGLSLLDFIWTTQQFPLIWMTTGGGPINATEVISTYTYKLAFSRYEFSLASASAVVILVASMLVAFVYARQQKSRD